MDNARAPRWNKWRLISEVRAWEAVALSLNIEPEKVKTDSLAWMSAKHPFEEGDEFNDRLSVLLANLSDRAHFPTPCIISMEAGYKHGVRLAEFASFAEHAEWPIPKDLQALARKDVRSVTPADTNQTGAESDASGDAREGAAASAQATVWTSFYPYDEHCPLIDCEAFISSLAEAKHPGQGEDGVAAIVAAHELREDVESAVQEKKLTPRRGDGLVMQRGLRPRAELDPFDGLYFEREEFVNFARERWLVRLDRRPVDADSAKGVQMKRDALMPLEGAAAHLAQKQWGDDASEDAALAVLAHLKAMPGHLTPIGAVRALAELEVQRKIDGLVAARRIPLYSPVTLSPTNDTNGALVRESELTAMLASAEAAIVDLHTEASQPSGETSPAPASAPITHRLNGRATPLSAEIAEAKRRVTEPENPLMVYSELSKLAEQQFGSMLGYSSDGVQYRGKTHQETGVPDVFTLKNLRDRMGGARRRAKAREGA